MRMFTKQNHPGGAFMMGLSRAPVKHSIDKIEITEAWLAGRAGLILVAKYLEAICIVKVLGKLFSFLKKSSKGTPLGSIFRQLLCFFFDSTSLRLVRFDQLKRDEGYAASIETPTDQMLSSHAVKRFLQIIHEIGKKPCQTGSKPTYPKPPSSPS